MKRLLVSILALIGVCSMCLAQTDQERGAALDDFVFKVHKLDLYNMILPVLMTKDQLKALLPVIEKCRQRVRETYKSEYTEIKPFQSKVDDAVKAAEEKGEVPSHDFLNSLFQLHWKAQKRREIMAAINAGDVYDAAKKVLNAGQLKVMANSLNPKEIDPTLKPEELKQDDKIELYVRHILLDPDAYDILSKMSMK